MTAAPPEPGHPGFTVDPEIALVEEGYEGPRLLVHEVSSADIDFGYEIALDMDPDGYFFGKSRDWTFTIESTDPAYSPSRMLKQMMESMIVWSESETTVSLERHLMHIYLPVLRRRDRIVAKSTDGERTIVLTKMGCERTQTTPRAPDETTRPT
jgi:hypothetical protein